MAAVFVTVTQSIYVQLLTKSCFITQNFTLFLKSAISTKPEFVHNPQEFRYMKTHFTRQNKTHTQLFPSSTETRSCIPMESQKWKGHSHIFLWGLAQLNHWTTNKFWSPITSADTQIMGTHFLWVTWLHSCVCHLFSDQKCLLLGEPQITASLKKDKNICITMCGMADS